MKKKASPTPKKNSPAKKKVAKPSVKEKPIILITNDDGITAPGIRNLVEAVKDIGKIVVVAPDKPQSGMDKRYCIDWWICRLWICLD